MDAAPEDTRTNTEQRRRGEVRPAGFREELQDAISTRTVLLVVGVLLLQLGFIYSYVGAFHHQPSMLPSFWRVIGGALPNGAGTAAVRRIVYFGGHGITRDVIVIYAVVGAAVAVVASRGRQRGSTPSQDSAEGVTPLTG